MDVSPMKSNRKVRFSLPDNNIPTISAAAPQHKQRLYHGTLQYVNGTLVSQPATPASSPPTVIGHETNRQQQLQPTQLRPTKTKDTNTKIVLHLRPSTGVDKFENVDISGKPAISGTLEKGPRKIPKSSLSKIENRAHRMLPQINQKFPSSEELNPHSSTSREICHRHKSNDDLGSKDANNNVQQLRKQSVTLRSLSNLNATVGPKSASSRPRSKSLGKISSCKPGKPLISPHLQQQESNITIKVQESSPSRRASLAENAEQNSISKRHSSVAQTNGGNGGEGEPVAIPSPRPKPQYAQCNFLTVPEFTDRYEGMETVVSGSATVSDDDEENEEGDGGQNGRSNDNRTNAVDIIELKKSGGTRGSKRAVGGNGIDSNGESEPRATLPLNDASFKCIQDTNLGRDRNVLQFWDFVERWRANRTLKKLDNNSFAASNGVDSVAGGGGGSVTGGGNGLNGYANGSSNPSSSVQIGGSGKSDVKSPTLSSRIRALRMSMEQVPTVTTLLRASRDANEHLLKEVFRDILENGISRENLNSTDRSGRTAISYICSTNLTNFLELFLQLPGIDVNKPDNEGNTPLHFAAQAGLSDIVNMLITKCRSLVIDPKNNLGFTPLMKAALQGRTRCAKLLLFAGASPVETDTGRGFRAEQWARFCGRHTCAETIEQCARARLLDKSTPCGKWSHDINLPIDKNVPLKATRSSSITPQTTTQNGIRSKFRKVFPFNFSSKDKHTAKEVDENYTKDLVNYLKSATICVSGPALSANKKIIQSLIRPLEVPKLEVTYANNNALIKKYEAADYGCNGATGSGDERRDSSGSVDSRHSTPQHSPVPATARGKIKN
ncbi:uncharacterized protein LOC128737266 [Sabethes cyaneus]|uniref:uncharacterized protein LOC128737266 n=1 Tax=Sabethes cyaneus TaxID=53552 RepID=UPI00237E487C|nr:uncharacterized protein LOC128737266 [Sabethes cyaneus]